MKKFLIILLAVILNITMPALFIIITGLGIMVVTKPLRQSYEYKITKKATVKFIDSQIKKIEEYAND